MDASHFSSTVYDRNDRAGFTVQKGFENVLEANVRRLPLVLLAVSVVACTRKSPTAPPSTPNISGNWSGTVSSDTAGNGTISFTISQMCLTLLPPGSGCEGQLSGSGVVSFANSTSNENGALSGYIAQSLVVLTLTQSTAGPCPLNFSGTMVGSTIMRGIYSSAHVGGAPGVLCPTPDFGMFSVTKQ